MVERDSELATIRLAGVVDEASRSAHMLAVNNEDLIVGVFPLFGELVEGVKVGLLAGAVGFLARGGFFVGDHFATVGVDELAFLQVGRAAKTWSQVSGIGFSLERLDLPQPRDSVLKISNGNVRPGDQLGSGSVTKDGTKG